MIRKDRHLIQYEIPTPKVKPRDRRGIHGWLYYYAAFSPQFVATMLRALGLNSDSLVLDPFVGSGTTCLVAKQQGIGSIGVELNPLAYLVSSAKLAWGLDPKATLDLLKRVEGEAASIEIALSGPLSKWGASAQPLLKEALKLGRAFLRIQEQEPREFLLCSLVLSLSDLLEIRRGSNPVWLQNHALKPLSKESIGSVVTHRAKKMLEDLAHARTNSRSSSAILYGDSRAIALDRPVDAILTSPPYLNRLDYIVSHRLQNDFLSALEYPVDKTVDQLRTEQIGTVRVIDKSAPKSEWGQTCNGILKMILAHPSKAARSYYYPTIMRYFKDMYLSLGAFHRVLKPGGRCCIVVQTSYFKETEIPVSTIFAEMGASVGFEKTELVRREAVKTHMGLLDPEQRNRVPHKILHEDVIVMR